MYGFTPAHKGLDAASLIRSCRQMFATYGVPGRISSDDGPQLKAGAFKNFMGTWGVDHRRSSAYLPQSNGRAEVGVKSMERILTENISESMETGQVCRIEGNPGIRILS